MAEKRGYDLATLRGTAQNDIFEGLSADFTSADTLNGNGGVDVINITDAATVVDADFTPHHIRRTKRQQYST